MEFEINQGAYNISCPDAQCPKQGIIQLEEIESLVSIDEIEKHHRYRLNKGKLKIKIILRIIIKTFIKPLTTKKIVVATKENTNPYLFKICYVNYGT